jgi:hypothetical protein
MFEVVGLLLELLNLKEAKSRAGQIFQGLAIILVSGLLLLGLVFWVIEFFK